MQNGERSAQKNGDIKNWLYHSKKKYQNVWKVVGISKKMSLCKLIKKNESLVIVKILVYKILVK